MNNRKLKILLGIIGIFAIVPLLMSMSPSLDNDANTTSNGANVLFPDANADVFVEINDYYNSKTTAGDAANDDGSFIITDTYVDLESCEFCTRIQYTPGESRVAGFSYMDEGGFDLTNAKRVTFLAKGVSGDAEIKFMVGGKDSFSSNQGVFKNQKFEKITMPIKLDNDWQFIEIDISNGDLKEITYPFAMEIKPAKDSGQIVFFIKNIFIDTQIPENPIATESDNPIDSQTSDDLIVTENDVSIGT